jgi:hypothetical protein
MALPHHPGRWPGLLHFAPLALEVRTIAIEFYILVQGAVGEVGKD